MSKKRTPFQREKDLQRVARLYLSGRTQCEIAEDIGVTQQQISKDVRTLQKRWLESSLRDFDEMKAEQLAKIDKLETEYWGAWERSKKQRTRKTKGTKTGDTNQDHAQVVVEERDGNPTYLAGVERCIERRCKLLGLDAPINQNIKVEQTFADFVLAATGEVADDGDERAG